MDYQNNTYRKGLSWLHFDDEPRIQRQQVKDQQSCISVFVAFPTIPSSNLEHQPRNTTVFHTWPYGRFTEIQSNLRRKNLRRMNQGSDFPVGSFSNRDNVRAQIQSEEKVNPSILKDDFSSITDLSIFTSIAPVFLDRSNETS